MNCFICLGGFGIVPYVNKFSLNNNNNNNNKLQLGYHPVAVVVLHAYKM